MTHDNEDLAQEIRAAEEREIWNGFGRDIQDAANKGEFEYVGLLLRASPTSLDRGKDVGSAVSVAHRLEGDDAEKLASQLSGRGPYIVLPARRSAAHVDKIRREVSDAIEDTS